MIKNLYTRYPIVARALGLADECVARAKVSCIQIKNQRLRGGGGAVHPVFFVKFDFEIAVD